MCVKIDSKNLGVICLSLVICSECGGKVSTLAEMCPHCGCPVAHIRKNICVINQQEYDLSAILDLALGYAPGNDNRILGRKGIAKLTGLSLADACQLWEDIIAIKAIPAQYPSQTQESKSSAPRCPTCGSTSLTKIGAGTRAVDGLFFGRLSVEGRAQWRCNSCNHMW